jgi:hypothetical protein
MPGTLLERPAFEPAFMPCVLFVFCDAVVD